MARPYSLRILTLWDHGGAYGGYGPDEVSGNVLSVKSLQSVFSSTGSKFDILGFDACLMASSEVVKELQPFSNYMLASEDLEPGHGWNWDHVVTNFAQQSDIEQLGKNLVDSFTNNDSHQYKSDGKTLSFLKMQTSTLH